MSSEAFHNMGCMQSMWYVARSVGGSYIFLGNRYPLTGRNSRPIEVSQSRDMLTSHTFVTPYWRSSHSLPGMLWYGVEIVKVFI